MSVTHSTVIDPKTSYYTRSYSSDRTDLEQDLVKLYTRDLELTPDRLSAYQCKIYPSGMNAIYNLAHCIGLKYPNSVSVIGNELYCDTPRVFDDIAKYTGAKIVKVHVLDNEGIVNTFKTHGNRIKIFFIESCTNPSGHLFDWSLVSQLRRYSPGCIICVDNTWLSPVLFNPLAHGADVIVDSMTKYISASTRIGGCIVTNHMIVNDLDIQLRRMGLNYDSDTCKVVRSNLASIDERMNKISEIMRDVIEFLKSRSEVTRVHHPGSIAGMYAGCISFHVASNKVNPQASRKVRAKEWDNLKKLIESLIRTTKLAYETSYGSSYSKIDSFPKEGTSNCRDYMKQSDSVPGVWLRLSIGYGSCLEDVTSGLEKLLTAM